VIDRIWGLGTVIPATYHPVKGTAGGRIVAISDGYRSIALSIASNGLRLGIPFKVLVLFVASTEFLPWIEVVRVQYVENLQNTVGLCKGARTSLPDPAYIGYLG
jgi:hypothetical protein